MPTASPPLKASEVRFSKTALEVVLADGRVLAAPIDRFPKLRGGSPAALLNWRIVPGGQAVSWPDLNETIAVETLLALQAQST